MPAWVLGWAGCDRPAATKADPLPGPHSAPASAVHTGVGGDSEPPPHSATPPAPIFVLAGGGSEGDRGDGDAWSARLYGALLSRGDVSGDGRVTVAILAMGAQSEWLAGYFRWLGADEAFDVRLDTRADADDEALRGTLAEVDAFFLKGGDQGAYYDAWNDTVAEEELRRVVAAGGGVGGTSAGAMSLAGVALAGGQDLISADVLADACSRWLDDASDGGSGLHVDFLGFLPGVLVDTHATVRGRLGRTVGALARAVDDGLPARVGLGLDERTGLVVDGSTATVVGVGAVTVVAPGPTAPVRRCGRPLAWTDLPLASLVDGWQLDLDTLAVTPGPRATPAAWDGVAADNAPGDWVVDGVQPLHETRFAIVADRAPYALRTGRGDPAQADAIGLLDAHSEDRRGPAQEVAFAALADRPGATAFLVGAGARLTRGATADVVRFGADPGVRSGELATLVVSSAGLSAVDRSPEPSNVDVDGTLFAAGAAGLVLHVVAEATLPGVAVDTCARTMDRP